MIRLGTVYPERLNLNGDQGNLLALTKFLRLAGFEVEVRPVSNTAQALDCHFVLLGHGSMAAMDSLESVLSAMDIAAITSAVPGIAVGSGYEWLSSNGFTAQSINRQERESEFQVGSLGAVTALGYRNTDSGLPNLAFTGKWLCTMLHGPVLAKNPVLLARIAKAVVEAAGSSWPHAETSELREWVDVLNEVCSRIWALETDEPFQRLEI